MARPQKKGIDYFSHDVHAGDDRKMKLIISKFPGLTAYGMYFRILEMIYSEGYYLEWNEEELIMFSNFNNVKIEICRNIINELINIGLFDKKIYSTQGVLTSNRIQATYIQGCQRKGNITFIKEYLLIDLKEVKTKDLQLNIVSLTDDGENIIVNNNSSRSGVIVDNNPTQGELLSTISTQNKREYNKGNYNKESNNSPTNGINVNNNSDKAINNVKFITLTHPEKIKLITNELKSDPDYQFNSENELIQFGKLYLSIRDNPNSKHGAWKTNSGYQIKDIAADMKKIYFNNHSGSSKSPVNGNGNYKKRTGISDDDLERYNQELEKELSDE